MRELRRRRQVWNDLVELADYIAMDDPNASERFLIRVEETIGTLADLPRLGGVWTPESTRTTELRWMPVRSFPLYLVFYHIHPDSVEIVRVLHTSRDIDSELQRG